MIRYMIWEEPEREPITFIYNEDAPIADAFFVLDPERHPEVENWLKLKSAGFFLANDNQQYDVYEQPLLFFTEYIPRVFGFPPNFKMVKRLADVPNPGRRKTM